jgi:polyphosphate kinase 2 (PPK2 family)
VWNRSHYEDVLIVRVHNMVEKKVWQARYEDINNFEEMLTRNGVTILKFYLHISKDEQKERLQARLDNPEKTGSSTWRPQRACPVGRLPARF